MARQAILFCVTVILAVGLASQAASGQAASSRAVKKDNGAVGKNLIRGGGFEHWVSTDQLHPWILRSKSMQSVKLSGKGQLPEHWVAGDTPYEKKIAYGGQVSRDGKVHHEGSFSVRIHNARATDITYVQYMPDGFKGGKALVLKPHYRYEVTWWVRGEKVRPADGPGPLMMMYYAFKQGKRTQRVYLYPHRFGSHPLKGTFPWRRERFVFTTQKADPDAPVQAVFSFQLRRATGTVWYDQIALTELGPVTAVQTY